MSKTELIIIAKNREQAIAKANSYGISMEIIASTPFGEDKTYVAHTPVHHREERIINWYNEVWDTKEARLDLYVPIVEAA